jgi:hypothetical protein
MERPEARGYPMALLRWAGRLTPAPTEDPAAKDEDSGKAGREPGRYCLVQGASLGWDGAPAQQRSEIRSLQHTQSGERPLG